MEAKTNEEFFNVSALIDERFGKEGTVTRAEAEEKAYAFYTGQIIEDARKKAKITQAELARRIGSDRSYISRVESGQTEPKYDYVEGFLIADGIINIKSGDAGKSVKDGLQVNGGMVGFGGSAKSIVITRDMKLADKQLYPIVAVMADSRYGKTALTFFGAEFTVYKQEVGYKPY